MSSILHSNAFQAMKKIIALMLFAFFFNSCASILNPPYQRIEIETDSANKVLIDSKKPVVKKGKYLVKRDGRPKQITIEKDGYKKDNFVVMQNTKSPWHILSIIPFGIFLYPPFMDFGPKSFNYPPKIQTFSRKFKLPSKKDGYKNIQLNKVAVDISKENLKIQRIKYNNYLNNKNNKASAIDIKGKESIKVENTTFVNLLNKTLAEKGFIDTSNRVLKGSYLDNLLVNATIKEVTYNVVSPSIRVYSEGFTQTNIVIKWDVLDYYQKSIYSKEIASVSGDFSGVQEDSTYHNSIKDAIEYNFIEFMNSPDVIRLLTDRSQKDLETNIKELTLPNPSSPVSNLEEAIKSCLTIRNKNGHGSGFFISNEGHILTNYHVIADTASLKAVLSDGKEYRIKVLRESKIHDVALLKIEAKNEYAFQLNSQKEFSIGTDIYAIGTPTAEDLSQTLSKGIISGRRTIGDKSSLIQTDASINSGNSGGVVTDKNGILVGVVSSKLKGFGIEGVAFCIPIKEAITSLKIKQ